MKEKEIHELNLAGDPDNVPQESLTISDLQQMINEMKAENIEKISDLRSRRRKS